MMSTNNSESKINLNDNNPESKTDMNNSTNSNVPSKTTTSSSKHLLDIVKYMKNKIPSFLLFLHVIFFNYIYESCDPATEKYDIMIGYYVFSSVICIVWEFLYCYFNLKKANGTLDKRDYVFCSLSTIVSLISFLSTTFFMNIGNAYECYFTYDKVIASVVFFLSYGIIIGFSTLEKFCIQKEMKIMASSAVTDNDQTFYNL